MSYPPSVPPNTRTDATPLPTNHAADHNTISDALTDIINELGSDPSGAAASLTARLDPAFSPVQIASTGPAGVQRLNAIRFGSFVFFEGYTSGSTAGIAIPNANFPTGMRPVSGAAVRCHAVLNNLGTVNNASHCTIGDTGNITPIADCASWAYINGVFRAA